MPYAQVRPSEERHLVRLLCQVAARQEEGAAGRTARRLVAGGWRGDPVELIETARAVTAGWHEAP
jgi:hypothetical protein